MKSINSLYSIYCCLERPIIYGALLDLQARVKASEGGSEDLLPLIEQVYYPTYRDMQFTPSYPIVVKAGSLNFPPHPSPKANRWLSQ